MATQRISIELDKKPQNEKDLAAVHKKNEKKDQNNEADQQVKKCKAEMRKNDVVAGIFAVCLQIVNFAEVIFSILTANKGRRVFQRNS